jgi:peptidoglycan-N-acetylglucosamine deacetylase
MARICSLLIFLLLAALPATAQKRIALSFDDVPRSEGAFLTPDQRTKLLIAALKKAHVAQAGFFVTTGYLEKPYGVSGEAHITAYAKAGHVIGNHSYSHPWLNKSDTADYIAEIDNAESWLFGRPGYRPWFRFPFLNESGKNPEQRDAIRTALKARGLKNAYVTIDSFDWHMENIVRDAVAAGKKIDRRALRNLYVDTLVQDADHYEAIAVKVLGRSPAHVMLLHETDLNALFLADVARALRKDGWEIVPLDEAYADPIAASEPDTSFLGAGRIAALATVKGWQPAALAQGRRSVEMITELFGKTVLK